MGWVLGVAVGLTAAAGAAALWPAAAGRIAVAAVQDAFRPSRAKPASSCRAPSRRRACSGRSRSSPSRCSAVPAARAAFAALAILTAVPIAANRRIAPAEHEAGVFPPSLFARAVARRDPAGAYRTIDEAAYRPASALQLEGNRASPWGTALTRRRWGYHAQSLWGRGTVFNVDVDRGDLSRLDSLRSVSLFAASQPDGAPFFSALSLRFGDPLPGPGAAAGLPPLRRRRRSRTGTRTRTRARTSGCSSAGARSPARSPRSARCPGLDAGEVVLETGRRASGTARPADAADPREQSRAPGASDVSAPDPTWLFVLRGFWSYRTVRVDGVPVEARPGAARVHRGARARGRATASTGARKCRASRSSRWGRCSSRRSPSRSPRCALRAVGPRA